MSTITDQTLSQWKTGTAAQRIAADIASRISGSAWERFEELPPTEDTASQHDVSPRTASRARKLLLDAGVLGRTGSVWFVA
ncbi:MAG: hypothetical protein ACRDN0_17295 [Trebonia sp.]